MHFIPAQRHCRAFHTLQGEAMAMETMPAIETMLQQIAGHSKLFQQNSQIFLGERGSSTPAYVPFLRTLSLPSFGTTNMNLQVKISPKD